MDALEILYSDSGRHEIMSTEGCLQQLRLQTTQIFIHRRKKMHIHISGIKYAKYSGNALVKMDTQSGC